MQTNPENTDNLLERCAERLRRNGFEVVILPDEKAAGAFIQGASIELSCDAPMREPYTAYFQGGLTYESGKAGVMLAVEELLKA